MISNDALRVLAAGVLALMLIFCSGGCITADNTDAGLRARIVGTWYERPDLARGSVYFEKDYRPDGTTAGFFALAANDEHPQVTFTGLWRIESGRLYSTVLHSSNAMILSEGLVTPDVVRSIDSRRMVLIATDDGKGRCDGGKRGARGER